MRARRNLAKKTTGEHAFYSNLIPFVSQLPTWMSTANMDALKQKLMKCAGDDVEIVSVEKTPKEGAAAMKMACKDRTSSEVHTMTVKLETAERANKRKMADRKSAAKRRANATDDDRGSKGEGEENREQG